jgi:hypothetical protein
MEQAFLQITAGIKSLAGLLGNGLDFVDGTRTAPI